MLWLYPNIIGCRSESAAPAGRLIEIEVHTVAQKDPHPPSTSHHSDPFKEMLDQGRSEFQRLLGTGAAATAKPAAISSDVAPTQPRARTASEPVCGTSGGKPFRVWPRDRTA